MQKQFHMKNKLLVKCCYKLTPVDPNGLVHRNLFFTSEFELFHTFPVDDVIRGEHFVSMKMR